MPIIFLGGHVPQCPIASDATGCIVRTGYHRVNAVLGQVEQVGPTLFVSQNMSYVRYGRQETLAYLTWRSASHATSVFIYTNIEIHKDDPEEYNTRQERTHRNNFQFEMWN